jgi:cellulose synthase/poly-beta-1,6-N-acetylglucosamine synthase-like glycosyltransferase
MNELIIFIFFIALILLLNSYLFYPLFLVILNSIRKSDNKELDVTFEPTISILISAFNEEKVIEETIRNFFSLDYNKDKLEIIVGSDNSTDSTNQILTKLSEEFNNLKILLFDYRQGKQGVLNSLVKESSSEILVFTDANTIFRNDAIRNLIKHYTGNDIGGVCGKLVLLDSQETKESGSQEKTYWDIESKIKNLEGNLGFVIGANGGIYSIRRELFSEIPQNTPIMDDLFISLKVLEQNKKFVYANDAIAEELNAPSIKIEFNRKIRNNSFDLNTIRPVKKLLSLKYGLVSYAFFSHKIIRWITPILLILLFVSSLYLQEYSKFFEIVFIAQIVFYLFSILGWILNTIKIQIKIFVLPYYFVITNIAMLIGLWKFYRNSEKRHWQSTKR